MLRSPGVLTSSFLLGLCSLIGVTSLCVDTAA
ncbi:MAG: transglutaminase, partial [Mesorhizobium sp.]